jgi:non-lysosomal glucosylceramidase
MIQEQLACGCMDAVPPKLDAPCGRTMGDVTSMFIVYLLELWQWTADENLLKELWPAAKAAAEWQIDRATNPSAPGLPHHLIDTYDGLALENYNASAFSGFFHLLAMKAARALALSPPISDDAFAANCSAALQAGREGMDRLLWNTTEKFYRSYTAPADPPAGTHTIRRSLAPRTQRKVACAVMAGLGAVHTARQEHQATLRFWRPRQRVML